MKTFKYDSIVRDFKGIPLGKLIMPSGFNYVEGQDIEVVLLKFPSSTISSPFGLMIYIDECPYKVPSDLPKIRQQKLGGDWYFTNFILKRA